MLDENAVTVEEMLALPQLRGMELIAGGNGARREVSSVVVVDSFKSAEWISGGAFVLAAPSFSECGAHELAEFVRLLHQKKSAALGLKPSAISRGIMREALAAAEFLDFPIISAEGEAAFRDTAKSLLEAIVDRRAAKIRQADKIREKFLRMAVDGKGVGEMLAALREETGRGALFADTHFRRLYFSDDEISARFEGIDAGGLTAELCAGYERRAVRNSAENFGFILLESDGSADGVRDALKYAASAVALRMMDGVANQRVEEKYRGLFLEDLITNNVKTEAEIHNRARLYGWDFRHGGFVVVVDINNIKKFYTSGLDMETDAKLNEASRIIFSISTDKMLSAFPDAKCYEQSDLAVFIVSPERYDQNKINLRLESLFAEIRSAVAASTHFTVTMGVGEYFPNIRDIHKSYAQARTSINLGYRLEKFDCILFYGRMGIYRLLSQAAGTKEAEEFVARYLHPLEAYDAKYGATLASTLEAIIKCGWNLKLASDELHIHYNSVKYRFGKICELTASDLRDGEERLAVSLALKLSAMKLDDWQ